MTTVFNSRKIILKPPKFLFETAKTISSKEIAGREHPRGLTISTRMLKSTGRDSTPTIVLKELHKSTLSGTT
jgi:hypothetical protein